MRRVPSLTVAIEVYPIEGTFTISRGSKREAIVVVATITDGHFTGRGEATPYARYGETVEAVADQIRAAAHLLDRDRLSQSMPAGAARNAIDCALWDFEAKRTNRTVAELAGLSALHPITTAYTLSLASADEMATRAKAASDKPLLKLKLGGPDDVARLRAVRQARLDARIIVDANESWTVEMLIPMLRAAAEAGVELIEQPLPTGQDDALASIDRIVPICADESLHTRADLPRLARCYDAVNIKLDKSGGLTEALTLRKAAETAGLKIMIGCMVATSLAMAPAVLLAQGAAWADLDGPLLLANDRAPGLTYSGATLHPPTPDVWG
jgi:L-alanine-DL-glutamate epimerase-like enolase superfamily enzyme